MPLPGPTHIPPIGEQTDPTKVRVAAIVGGQLASAPARGFGLTAEELTFIQSGVSTATVSPFAFGGVGDGVADDRAAIQQAIDYLYTTYVGGEVDMSGGRWLVDSGNITVKQGVQLVGPYIAVGEVFGGNYTNLSGSIVLNPLYSIHLAEDFSGIKGLYIINKNIGVPANVRQMLDMVNAFSGKGITVGDVTGTIHNQANDTYVGHCLVLGFQYAYWNNYNERPIIEYLKGDNTNGIYLKDIYDTAHVSRCHFFAFLSAHRTDLGAYQFAVSNAVNNGSGLIRLTIAAHPLITGDIILVNGITGTVEANNRWTITVINSTTVDLQGSSFANAYASGGTLSAQYSLRHGTGYDFQAVDGGTSETCFCWGYDLGLNVEGSHFAEFIGGGADHAGLDPTAVGCRVKDSNQVKLIGWKTAGLGTGVIVDTGTTFTGASLTTCGIWSLVGTGGTGVKIVSGRCTVVNCMFFNMPTGIYVDPNSRGLHAIGNQDMSGVTNMVDAPPGRGLRSSFISGNSWNNSTGTQLTFSNVNRDYKWEEISDVSSGMALVMRKARGSQSTPTAAILGDSAAQLRGDFWDGVDQFRPGGLFRIAANGAITATSVPTRMYWSLVNTGSTSLNDIMSLTPTALGATTDITVNLGGPTNRWAGMYGQYLTIQDGMNTPGTLAGCTTIFVDTADGDLKVKFGDGTVKTIVVDT